MIKIRVWELGHDLNLFWAFCKLNFEVNRLWTGKFTGFLESNLQKPHGWFHFQENKLMQNVLINLMAYVYAGFIAYPKICIDFLSFYYVLS